jgi:hypothetical protein
MAQGSDTERVERLHQVSLLPLPIEPAAQIHQSLELQQGQGKIIQARQAEVLKAHIEVRGKIS